MDLDGLPVADDDHRLAEVFEPPADLVRLEYFTGPRLDHEHRLEPEGVLEVRPGRGDPRRPRPGLPGDRVGRGPALDLEEGPLEQPEQALAAGVDDPRLAQDRQQVGRLGDRPLGRQDRSPEDRLDVRVVPGRLESRVGGLPNHGQDRALDRVADRRVGQLRSAGEGLGKIGTAHLALALEGLGQTATDLRGDHARVAPGSHQGPQAERGRDLFGRAVHDELGFLEGDPDGGQHVRAGIAVGHGEDVELVDLVDVAFEVGDGCPEGEQETRPVGDSSRARSGRGPPSRADGAGPRQPGLWAGLRPDLAALPADDVLS